MNKESTKFEESIPEFYDHHLGPVLFEPYAADMAARVAAVAPTGPVLETSCGTGILTNHLRAKLLSSAHIVATDLSQPMIDVAFRKQGLAADVEWKQADACALPFSDRTFAAVVNQFGLMFITDKAAAIREAERVLKDGGFFAFSVWDNMDLNPFAHATNQAMDQFFTSGIPTFYQIPFGFHDPQLWTGLLKQHGFGQIEVHKLCLDVRSDSAESFATGLIRGNPVIHAIEERGVPANHVISALTNGLIQLGGDQPFTCRTNVLVFTARANS